MEKFTDSLWDWAILDGCFGDTRIRPTDVDGLVEKNGQFLLLEAKNPGVPLKAGQVLLFDALRKTGRFTILVMWGPRNQPQQYQLFTQKRVGRKEACNLQTIRAIVSQWYEWAAGQKERKFG